MRVTWHRRARQDLRHIRAQIAAENPQAAQRVALRILRAVELLAEQPGMGRVGRVPDTREFVITDTACSLSGRADRPDTTPPARS